MSTSCPFCSLSAAQIQGSQELFQGQCLVLVIRDRYPVSPGHTLILPRRHVQSFFETTPDEQRALLEALEEAKAGLETEFAPDGYNIGINDGAAAGQTVPHLHIHLIPRYASDIADARGGVRWIFPDKAKYW